jgi:hypothetical protein
LDAIIDIYKFAGIDDLCDIFVVDVASRSQYCQERALFEDVQVLVIASSCVLVIGCDVQLGATFDGDVGIARGVSSTDFGSFLI